MPRKIRDSQSLDEIETEVLYTRAALWADPDASDLVALTEGWLESVEGVRTLERALRRKTADADARRAVANQGLEEVCTRFVDDLYLAVGKDKRHLRFRSFFPTPVSRFMRSALPRQVIRVRGWLDSRDEVFLKHRSAIEGWLHKAHAALVNTRSLALARGESSIARAELAEDLTHDRDGLHLALVERARERQLGRAWANTFFRVGNPRRLTEEVAEEAVSAVIAIGA